MGTTAEQDPAALKTEAAELQTDITEAKQEAQQAREAGNDERADRIEASIAKTQTELEEIKTMLKGFTDRPFHPAPGDGEQPPATPPEGEQKQDQAAESEGEQKPPKKKHWLFGDRWNQE